MAEDNTLRQRAGSFGSIADAYARSRPSYPQNALDWLLNGTPAGPARRVLDLGAGTGKLTGQLTARGLDVVAVEPSDGMRVRLSAAAPGADVRAGTAEHIPLPDGDVDAVLVAQAWHWFDHDRALAEIARVLRPGGTLGLIWNTRDARESWVRELSAIVGADGAEKHPDMGALDLSPHFGAAVSRMVCHTHELDLPALLDLMLSHSYVAVRPEPERARLLDAVADLARRHPDMAGRDRFSLRYVMYCLRAARVSGGGR